ncbi:MAG: hypothetical protein ACKVJG_05610 [Candidatus Latescibacterota bacterium]|jgi:hypothetical protein
MPQVSTSTTAPTVLSRQSERTHEQSVAIAPARGGDTERGNLADMRA